MHELPRLWRTLDEAGVLAGVEAQWLEWLGDELDLVRPFLRPEQQLAASYPCENPGGDGCPRRIVVHGDDDIVAVCGCSPRECDPLTLRRRDIVVYDFDVLALSRAIASVLGLGDEGRVTAGDVPGIYRLGALPYGAGQRAAVMLALHCGADDGQHPLERFLAEHDGQPTLLVVPVPLDHVRSQVAARRGVVLASCSDLLAIDGQHLVLRQNYQNQ